ncbi:MAG: metallophosphoesterase [Alicyclobacillus macrosporangiidus]|nr:metallophosphoesterase [Alicyclobacillus macrosporangiidus]
MATMIEESLGLFQKQQRAVNPSNFRFVLMGDSWVGPVLANFKSASNFVLEMAIQKAVEFDPLLIFHTGDAVFSGTTTQLNTFRNLVNKTLSDAGRSDIPFFVTPGNHDATKTGSFANYQRIIGPLQYTVDSPRLGFRLVTVNDATQVARGVYEIAPAQLRFAAQNLRMARKYKFLGLHVPPRVGAFKNFQLSDSTLNRGHGLLKLERIIRQNHVKGVLAGHVHGFFQTRAAGTDYVISGGAGAPLVTGQLQHITLVTLRNGRVTYREVPIGFQA